MTLQNELNFIEKMKKWRKISFFSSLLFMRPILKLLVVANSWCVELLLEASQRQLLTRLVWAEAPWQRTWRGGLLTENPHFGSETIDSHPDWGLRSILPLSVRLLVSPQLNHTGLITPVDCVGSASDCFCLSCFATLPHLSLLSFANTLLIIHDHIGEKPKSECWKHKLFQSGRVDWSTVDQMSDQKYIDPPFGQVSVKTLPEAQRTQKLTPWLGLNLATTWHHLH